MTIRHLILLLGDQLDEKSSALLEADPAQDVLLMIEAQEESTHVRSHQVRTALFLSAMRHFAQSLRERGWRVCYRQLGEHDDLTLATGLKAAAAQWQPRAVIGVEPGDVRVRNCLDAALPPGLPLHWRADTHFLCSTSEFARWAGSSKQLRMEFFYRQMRKKHRILMDGEQPVGGAVEL